MDAASTASRLRMVAWEYVEAGQIEAAALMTARAAELEREAFAPAVTASTAVIL